MRIAFFGSTSPTSFGTENELWREHLRELGHKVFLYERHTPVAEAEPADLAFFHPMYSEGEPVGISKARGRFDIIGGKDVVNYSYVGPRGRKVLSSFPWDFLALPHVPETVSRGWRGPRIVKWPRGLDPEITGPLSPIAHWVPRILLWADNACWERKGMDLNLKVLLDLQRRGYVFETIIKTRFAARALDVFSELKNKRVAVHYVDQRGVRRIYDYCDVLLHLHRGGGQEMCPMEAIARGLVVVVSQAGCTLDYATPKNSVLIPTTQWVPKMGWIEQNTDGSDSGFGYQADVKWAANELAEALDHLPERKARAAEESRRFVARWNVSRVLRENWSNLSDAIPRLRSSGETSRVQVVPLRVRPEG